MKNILLLLFGWHLLGASALGQAPSKDEEAEPQQAAEPTPSEIAARLSRYAHEPSVERVIAAALDAAPSPRADALASRARTAGWVPRVVLRARRGQGMDLASTSSDDMLRLSSGEDVSLEASLTFELDRVVFRSEEVALARQSNAEDASRQTRVREVIALYFERRRLQLERDFKGDPDLKCRLRITEIEALLDVFTNGAFRRMIGRSPWTTAGSTPDSKSPSSPKSKSTGTP